MTLFVKKILICGLVAEAILFFSFYHFGSTGKPLLAKLVEEKKGVEREIGMLQSHINHLAYKIKEGKTPFAKEKIARERLHMKKDKEKVYFIKREG